MFMTIFAQGFQGTCRPKICGAFAPFPPLVMPLDSELVTATLE